MGGKWGALLHSEALSSAKGALCKLKRGTLYTSLRKSGCTCPLCPLVATSMVRTEKKLIKKIFSKDTAVQIHCSTFARLGKVIFEQEIISLRYQPLCK